MNKQFSEKTEYTEISIATLRSVCSDSVGEKVLKAMEKAKSDLLPDMDSLQVGDIILSRKITEKSAPKSPVRDHQLQLGFPEEEAQWTHAMVYIGALHVAESVTWHWDTYRWRYRTGTRTRNLMEYFHDHELLICRPEDDFSLHELRHSVARHALLQMIVNPRRYGFLRVASMVWPISKKEVNFSKEIICSEFALECLAIGAGFMVQEFDDLKGENKYFLPAHFCRDPKLKKIILPKMRLNRAL